MVKLACGAVGEVGWCGPLLLPYGTRDDTKDAITKLSIVNVISQKMKQTSETSVSSELWIYLQIQCTCTCSYVLYICVYM